MDRILKTRTGASFAITAWAHSRHLVVEYRARQVSAINGLSKAIASVHHAGKYERKKALTAMTSMN